MKKFFTPNRLLRCHAIFFVVCVQFCIGGTARAATCDAGQYMNNGECTQCISPYYCPGDDLSYECPGTNLTKSDVLNLIPNISDYGDISYSTTAHTVTPTSITNCSMRPVNASNDACANIYTVLDYSIDSSDYTKASGTTLCHAAQIGYYLQNHYTGTGYRNVAPCTNEIPANSHYSGPGTPDVGDCPWECDDGFGHTSDDRCLPLCRIGDTAMNGINIYAEKHTKYAMAVPRNGATCWINATRDNGGKLQMVN
ncbi:MAG: hypothetical protein IJ560_02140 [Alphaproteobacteria bacterium]|nr:hypothetical protein [Alphaproteobacteria bacterium]